MSQNYTYKKLLFGFLLFFSIQIYSQDILWEKSYGGKHAEYLFDAIPTPDYGFILAGSSISNKNGNKSDNNKGDLDYWVWKMDHTGGLDWQKSFGGSGTDLLQSIKLTNDGGFILAGTSTSNKSEDKKDDSKGDSDFWIIKLDAKGGMMWQKTIGGNGQEKLQSIVCTKDGGYIIGGSSSSDKNISNKEENSIYGKLENSKGNLDYWVVKLSVNGTPEWQKTIGGNYLDELKSIEQTTDGGYILGGYSNSLVSGDKTADNFGLGDYWIVKLDETGNITWQKTIGGDQDDNLFALIQTKDKGFLLGGNSNSNATNYKKKGNGKGTDFWVVKLDESGEILWQETYDYGKTDVLTSIVENEDHTFLIGGYAQSEIGNQKLEIRKSSTSKNDKEGINDYIALKIKDNGEEIWTQTVGSKGTDILKRLIETRDGGYLLAGTSKGEQSRDKAKSIGGNDFWVVKLKDKAKKEKTKVAIEAYPNPAETFTNTLVNYDYNDGWATLYDLNGRQLQKFELHGEHTVPIQLGNIPSGVYIVNIKTNNGKNSVKIIKK